MKDEEIFKEIVDNMYETYLIKNHDYGNSTHKTYQEFGLTSFLVRLSDKLNRLITLNKTEALVKDEKIEDTLKDLANYSVLAMIELKKVKEFENKEYCQVCGVELTEENRYIKNMCNECKYGRRTSNESKRV